jgi:hypothetical protein
MKRKKGVMEFSLFRHIVDECASLEVESIVITGYGEPLIDRGFSEKVKYAKSKGITNVCAVTNGLLLNGEVSRNLISAGLDRISISLDAATLGTYDRIHIDSNFEQVENNILSLMKLKNIMGMEKPTVQLRFHEFELNEYERALFTSKYKRKVDEAEVYLMIHDWAGKMKTRNWPSGTRFPCINIWAVLTICWDGRVSLCCQDTECSVCLGDVRNTSIGKIWKGRKLMEIRGYHKRKKFDFIPLCKECKMNYHYMQPWFEML